MCTVVAQMLWCVSLFFESQPQVLLVRVDPGCTEPSEPSDREEKGQNKKRTFKKNICHRDRHTQGSILTQNTFKYLSKAWGQ